MWEVRRPVKGVVFFRFTRDPIGMQKVELRLFSANLLAFAGIAMLMMLGISTTFQKR
jgi:hypothetical protein